MFDKKTLLLSICVAAIVGTLLAVVLNVLLPGFADASPYLKGAIIGAACGLIYPLMARRKNEKSSRQNRSPE